MKRIAAIFFIITLLLMATSCGTQKEEPMTVSDEDNGIYEVAMIVGCDGIENGGLAQSAWKYVQKFAGERELSCQYYISEKETTASYIASVETALENGAELIIFTGSKFATAAHKVQSDYKDTSFLLIDGVPHSKNGTYSTANNTVSVMFAEEESGFLAGYAAVKDGYRSIGFMGGKELPAVKRYGYGFVQGASLAASELAENGENINIDLRYTYTGGFDESDKVKSEADEWYRDGTEVIFACRGAMSRSVIAAAEKNDGKVIGADVDQSNISESVITSAEKNIRPVVKNVLRDFAGNKFVGGMSFNYAAKNDGVKLEMKNSRFTKFSEDEYKNIFGKLKSGQIKLKKDKEVKSVESLLGDYIEIK